MKDIVIHFVDQKDQRYDTVGDYYHTDDAIVFKITKFDNPLYSMACLLHEIWEEFTTRQRGLTEPEILQFDLDHPELDDPGASKEAPYHKEHMQADLIERLCFQFANEEWQDYCDAVDALFEDSNP